MTELATPRRSRSRKTALADLATAFKGAMAAVRRLRGRDTHRPGELSFAQYHLLFGLFEHDELSSRDLAAAAELTPATVTQMLDSLVAMGLVERTRSTADRRVVICRLTSRGRELITERRAYFEARWRETLLEFSADELAIAARVVDRLRTFYDDLLEDSSDHAGRTPPG
jgi:DNA-binding MarR family transcriptional regulator